MKWFFQSKMTISILGILAGCALGFLYLRKPNRLISAFVSETRKNTQKAKISPCENPINLTFFIEHEDNVDLSDYIFTIRVGTDIQFNDRYKNPIIIKYFCTKYQGGISFDAQKVGSTKLYSWISIREYAADLKNNQDIKVKLLAEPNKEEDLFELEFLQ